MQNFNFIFFMRVAVLILDFLLKLFANASFFNYLLSGRIILMSLARVVNKLVSLHQVSKLYYYRTHYKINDLSVSVEKTIHKLYHY